MNSTDFKKLLKKALFPFIKKIPATDFVFQQDNAPIHASRATQQYLKKCKVKVMNWPSCSPDANPIENLWGNLARSVYKHGKRTFRNKNELKKVIIEEWEKIKPDYLTKLVKSMPRRCLAIIKQKGGKINY